MTDILLLGSFHFKDGKIDCYSPEAQKELNSIAQTLLRFSPDAVAVEWAAHQQMAVSTAYQKFSLYDLQNADKMRTETLGEIQMFNRSAPIEYNNEAVYLRANEVGNYENYLGVRMLAQWYERNLKIFSNIQRLAEQHKRIFVVYGAGHLQIMKDLICADNRFHLVDVMQYLPV